jgi:transposase
MIANTTPRCIGCDVDKHRIVIFDSRDGKLHSIANKAADLARFAACLDPTCLVICEATGGYEAGLLAALTKAGIPAHRADARKVKAFLRSFGTLAKTDAIDAKGLARYGEERHDRLRRWQAPDHARDQLHTLVMIRRDLVAARQAFANRLHAPGAALVKKPVAAVIACLEKQIHDTEAAIEALIEADDALRQAAKTIRTIPGVGPVTAANLIGLMPELGSLSRRQAASLAGLAPHPRQSGQTDGYRKTRGGRPEVKRALFMAALVAARHNPQLKTFYDRLCTNGKKPIVALTALMRKLIVIINAKLRNLKACEQVS